MSDKTYRVVDSVLKAFDILNFIAQQKGKAVLPTEICVGTSLPYPTVMCHLETLKQAGVVKQFDNGWQIGMALAVYWAAVKAGRESDRDRAISDLKILGD